MTDEESRPTLTVERLAEKALAVAGQELVDEGRMGRPGRGESGRGEAQEEEARLGAETGPDGAEHVEGDARVADLAVEQQMIVQRMNDRWRLAGCIRTATGRLK